MMSEMKTDFPRGRYAMLLALIPAIALAELDPPLPAAAESARVQGNVEVLSLELRVTPDNEIHCTGWKLTKADVRFFFRMAKPIAGETFHHAYYVMPCDYTGRLVLAGETYEFRINGGSHGYLTTTSEPRVARLFGCPRGCQRVFAPFEFFRPGASSPEG
jgi:hypothetical protein